METTNTEIKWIRLECKEKITIGVIYGKQENVNQETAEDQFNELTTQTNQLKKEGQIIIMGDINAKIKIETDDMKQETSRNGKLLEEFTETTNTHIVNTSKNHKGIWTRTNKQETKKSLIDYIIISEELSHKVIESETDEGKIYEVKGKIPTDHNTITATININAKKESTKSWRWKDGTPEQWVKYNNQVQEMWNTTDTGKKDSNRLNEVITRSLNDTIGKRWHQSNPTKW
jgi:hypothetical protein